MKQAKFTVRIRMAWWWPYYTAGVIAMCRATGRMPDRDRFGYWFAKAARVRLVYAPSTEDA